MQLFTYMKSLVSSAVETADVVVMFLSRKYMESPNCRSEAEYPIISIHSCSFYDSYYLNDLNVRSVNSY